MLCSFHVPPRRQPRRESAQEGEHRDRSDARCSYHRERERERDKRSPALFSARTSPNGRLQFCLHQAEQKKNHVRVRCYQVFCSPPPLPQTLRGSQVALGSLKSSSFRRPARRLACQAGKRGEGGERSHMTRGPPLTRSTGGMGPRAQRGGRRLAALNTCPRLRKVRKMLNVINVFPSRRGGGGPQYPPAIFYAHDRRKASEGSGVKTHSLTHSPCDIHGHVGR